MRSGGYKLTCEKWKEIISTFKPSPKKDILDAIDEWRRKNIEDFAENDEIFDDFEPEQLQG